MPRIDKRAYDPQKRKQYGASYRRLLAMIKPASPDAEKFRNILKESTAEGFPVDWPNKLGLTLLYCALSKSGVKPLASAMGI